MLPPSRDRTEITTQTRRAVFQRNRDQGSEIREEPSRLAGGSWGTLLPSFLVAVVAEYEGGDAALEIVLEGQAGNAGAVGIKERGRRLRGQLVDLAHAVFHVELVALAKDRDLGMTAGVAVLPGQAVEQRRSQLDGGRVEWNEEALGEGRRFRDRRSRRGRVVHEEPAGQLRLTVGAGPAVVLESLVEPQANVAACNLEGLKHEFTLALRDHGVVGSVKEPERGAAEGAGVLGGQG